VSRATRLAATARALALSTAILALLPCSTGQAVAPAKPVTHTVTIEEMQFKPAELTVKVGDSIVWVNKDMFPHTATSKAKAFDSQQIDPGQSWTYRAMKKGAGPYICALHPTMLGTLRIK
jgi:plastocyanin